MKIWNFFNGKKRTIGLALILVSQALRLLGEGEWADLINRVADMLNGAGITLGGVGLIHGAEKSIAS